MAIFTIFPGLCSFCIHPFAAVLAVPLALLPTTVVQVGWTAAGALALVAVLHRFGLKGWVLSLASTAVVYVVEPVVQTLAFGQLGIFLVALIVLDLVPGPRVFSRRLLPEGVLTAVATAIKLTPAIFVVYLLLVRKFRAFWTAVITGIVVTLITFAIVPAASWEFWTRLAHGDTGLGHSIIYYTNQSVMADIVRIFGLGQAVAIVGLVLSAAVAVAGVWAAMLWHRLGDIRLAVNLCGVAGLLASPVSWLHHFVWVVPLAMSLIERRPIGPRRLPTWYLALGWFFVGWVTVAPFTDLPNGADVELQWTWSQHVLASITAVAGLFLLASAIVIARPRVLTIFARADHDQWPSVSDHRCSLGRRLITRRMLCLEISRPVAASRHGDRSQRSKIPHWSEICKGYVCRKIRIALWLIAIGSGDHCTRPVSGAPSELIGDETDDHCCPPKHLRETSEDHAAFDHGPCRSRHLTFQSP